MNVPLHNSKSKETLLISLIIQLKFDNIKSGFLALKAALRNICDKGCTKNQGRPVRGAGGAMPPPRILPFFCLFLPPPRGLPLYSKFQIMYRTQSIIQYSSVNCLLFAFFCLPLKWSGGAKNFQVLPPPRQISAAAPAKNTISSNIIHFFKDI